MSVQRRRGQKATVFLTHDVVDARGATQARTDMDNAVEVKAAFIPQRSARAEVPGQQEIDVYRMILTHEIEGLGLNCQVLWRGAYWDVVTPPSYRHGTRQVRHMSVDIRERP